MEITFERILVLVLILLIGYVLRGYEVELKIGNKSAGCRQQSPPAPPEPEETEPEEDDATIEMATKAVKKTDDKELKSKKEFWNDLEALEKERERIETGNTDGTVFDALDHTRAVHERIAELKEAKEPKSASA